MLACQKEHKHVFHAHRALSKRQETAFPPVLTEEESILTSSIDNNTIEQWWASIGLKKGQLSDLVVTGTLTMLSVTILLVQIEVKLSGRQITSQQMASKVA